MDTAANLVRLIELVNDPALVPEVRVLLKEYGQYMYEELGLVAGKESFFKQLENFPGPAYFPPSGTFIAAMLGNELAGCVGIKKFDEERCEMKRMYARPGQRGKGIGRLLCGYVIDWCRRAKYKRILLDTNVEMKEAMSLYSNCGFIEILPYCLNENNHPVFMAYDL